MRRRIQTPILMKRFAVQKRSDEMKRTGTFSASFFRGSLQVFLVVSSLVSNLLSWGLLFFRVGFGTETVVFHYNAYFGVDLTARAWQLTILPAIGFLLFLGNIFLSIEFSRRQEPAVALAVSTMSLFAQVAVLIAVVALISVNT